MVPLISIAIPVFNGEKFIGRCLESIGCQQHLEDCEVLFVDDHSTDNSISKITEYIKLKKPKGQWRIESNKKNLGLVGNWNKCCELASGKWIMFLFQDDFLEPNAVAHRINLLSTLPYALFISDRNYCYDTIDDEKKRGKYYDGSLQRLSTYYSDSVYLSKQDISKLLIDNFLGQNLIGEPVVGIFKKELLNTYGRFNTQIHQICDYEFWLRIGLNEGLYYDSERIVNFRVHGQSTTKKNATGKVSRSKIDRVILGADLLTKSYYNQFRFWYQKQSYEISLHELYQQWCLQNIPLNRYFFKYKNLVDNQSFKMGFNFICRKLKDRLRYNS